MSDGNRRILAFLLASGVFALDRWSKWMIETHLSSFDTKTVIPGFFSLVYSQNPGIAFSMFADVASRSRTPVLIALSVVAVALLAVMLWRIDRLDTPSAAGLALILGGAMGNVFDRVSAGSVTDFLDFYTGTHHWYTFNVADASITSGAVLMIFSMLFSPRRRAAR